MDEGRACSNTHPRTRQNASRANHGRRRDCIANRKERGNLPACLR
jgi:hypothetical protein